MFHDYQKNLENTANLNNSLQGEDIQKMFGRGGELYMGGLNILWRDLVTP